MTDETDTRSISDLVFDEAVDFFRADLATLAEKISSERKGKMVSAKDVYLAVALLIDMKEVERQFGGHVFSHLADMLTQ